MVSSVSSAHGFWASSTGDGDGHPARDAIHRMINRFAVILRTTCTSVTVVVASVTASAETAGWRVVVALAAMVASTLLFAAVLLRSGSVRWVILVDLAVTTVICLLQGALLPPSLVAAGSSWVAAGASVAVVLAYLTLTLPVAVCGSLVVSVGWILGSMLGHAGDGIPHLVILGIQATVTAVLMVMLGRAAMAADAALRVHEAARRTEVVEAARRLDERMLRRRLHDTVLATLTMVGTRSIESGSPTLRARATEELTVFEELTAGAAGKVGLVRLDQWLSVAADRVRPLIKVAVELVACQVPTVVAEAVRDAVHEALANIAKHAEVESAVLRLAADHGILRVDVMDTGVGFDPTRVARHHLGLRESVIGRMTEVGGWATVISAVGFGCTVTIVWRGAVVAPGGSGG